MEDTRFIKSIHLRNLLSFGPESEEIELRPLNVLIGPNGSGKSNFIEAINILRWTSRDFHEPFRRGGGSIEYIWKGDKRELSTSINTNIFMDNWTEIDILNYGLYFNASAYGVNIISESLKRERDNDFIYFNSGPESYISDGKTNVELIPGKNFDFSQSIFSQFKDWKNYPKVAIISTYLGKIKIYRYIDVSYNSKTREPQKADLPVDFLSENCSNLSLIINDLKDRKTIKDQFINKLQKFYESLDYISTQIIGGTVQIQVYEKGLNEPIPVTRLSDGTLHFLCLLTILCHPSPPPLVCIEEPEVGLHPDIIPIIAELLLDASKRTQLIVTTHSDILVSALSDQPESILVCEHDDRGTHMRRLEQDKLKGWLKKYMLGEIWRMGEIGGNRW